MQAAAAAPAVMTPIVIAVWFAATGGGAFTSPKNPRQPPCRVLQLELIDRVGHAAVGMLLEHRARAIEHRPAVERHLVGNGAVGGAVSPEDRRRTDTLAGD